MRNVYDAAPGGEKTGRKRCRDEGKQDCVNVMLTAVGISREGPGLTPETALKHNSKGRWVAKGSYESKLKGKKCKPGTFPFL